MSPSWPYCITPCHSQGRTSHIPLLVPVFMLNRSSSADVTPDHVSRWPTGGGRPSGLITTQQPLRVSTAPTAETEPPKSEILPQESPPVPPPLPASSSHLPPGNSGLRQQSTPPDTHETVRSALEEHVPPRPPSVPSPHPDSGPSHDESANISGGIHADVWPTYNRISQEFDQKRLVKWNADLDVLLIFVSVAHYLTTIRLTRSAGRLVLCHRHSLPRQGPR